MNTFTNTVSTIKVDIPIVEQKSFNFITDVYTWGKNNPKSATALIAFIVGFILGTLI